jgi:hypothetical protein
MKKQIAYVLDNRHGGAERFRAPLGLVAAL